MSDQGPLPDRDADDFGLIETLLWTRERGFDLLPEHLARLAASSAALGFAYDQRKVEAALASALRAAAAASAQRLRLRLVLSRGGGVETSATPIEPVQPGTVWRVALAKRRFASSDPLLRHKTTRRALYEDELAQASRRAGADEVLFLNEKDEVCEGARCNLFLGRSPARISTQEGAALATPPLACGLLPGTLRARLISEGRAREAVLRLDDLAGEFLLGNSVRGLVRATLIS
jgi:4-amino-4-deoxychorismate lyase